MRSNTLNDKRSLYDYMHYSSYWEDRIEIYLNSNKKYRVILAHYRTSSMEYFLELLGFKENLRYKYFHILDIAVIRARISVDIISHIEKHEEDILLKIDFQNL